VINHRSVRARGHLTSVNRVPPRVLWVTEERPDIRLGGGSVRQAHLLKEVAKAMPVDLLVTGHIDDDQVRAAAANVTEMDVRLAFTPEQPLVRQLHWLLVALLYPRPWYAYGAGPRRRALTRALGERQQGYDIVCVEHEALAPLIPAAPAGRWVLTLHQVVSGELVQELAAVKRRRRRWLLERDLAKARRMEERAAVSYDQLVVCSEADAAAVAALARGKTRRPIAVVPNGVDLEHFRPEPIPSEPRVLFPGSFHFPPNIHGAIWLCAEIWPLVRTAVPNATLELVGREPDPRVLALRSCPGVSVEADVPSMAPYFERARAVAVPLEVGTVTRLKALEAMASGRPVIGTTIGLEGLDVVDGVEARLADETEAFANAIIEVLRDDLVAQRLAEAGRRHVEARFGWERIGRDYVQVLSQLAAS
jgi:glycosyltransferase involved in cell wall biosynthesis